MHTDPRKGLRRREVAGDCRFLTFSCYQRLPLFGRPEAADTMRDAIARARLANATGFELFAWVIMPEHVHVLVRLAPGVRWEAVASSVKTSVARRVLGAMKRSGDPSLRTLQASDGKPRFWQRGGGFDRTVRDEAEFARTVRYIHRNPVERGLVERAEDWRWSSVRWWMGRREGEIKCDPPPGRPGEWDSWGGFE